MFKEIVDAAQKQGNWDTEFHVPVNQGNGFFVNIDSTIEQQKSSVEYDVFKIRLVFVSSYCYTSAILLNML